MAFVSIITVGMVINASYLLSLHNSNLSSLKTTLTFVLAWLYDTDWLRMLMKALKVIQGQKAMWIALVTLYFYVLQFFLKNVLHRMFLSVIIEGRPLSRSLQEVPCHNRFHLQRGGHGAVQDGLA